MHTVNHSENIVELRNVSFARGDEYILRDVDLDIHRSDYLGIVGGNGSGKTTLLRIILGLLKPEAGTVKLFGKEIASFNEWSKIGYVPQKVTSFDTSFPATVFEVVLMGRYGRCGMGRSLTEADIAQARKALEQVDLWHKKDRLIGELSGGQQQRVFIARALAGEPEIVFLDEPTVGIAADIKKEFYALLRKMNVEMNLTVVLVTHDSEDMAEQAMHVACVGDQKITFHEKLDDTYKASHHQFSHPSL